MLKWYAYQHVNGQFFLKRYWDDYGDITEARESDFVTQVTEPFEAESRELAVGKGLLLLGMLDDPNLDPELKKKFQKENK